MPDIDLINWTVQEVQRLKCERREPTDADGIPSLDAFLAMIECDSLGPTGPQEPLVQSISAPIPTVQITEIQPAVEAPLRDEATEMREPDASALQERSDQTSSPRRILVTGVQIVEAPPHSHAVAVPEANSSKLPDSTQTELSPSVETQTDAPQPALLTTIGKANVHVATIDRDRAIALRWALRDIRGKRLKWSPIGQNDLQTLSQLGLVEVQDGVPVLTHAGAGAIA
jgi:hypothetical protein